MIIIHCQTGHDVKINSNTLENAMLDGLDLHRALLEGFNLTGASLRKVNSSCDFSQSRFNGKCFDDSRF